MSSSSNRTRRMISFKVYTTAHRQKKLPSLYQNRRCFKVDGKSMKALKKKSLSISSKYYQNVAFVSLSTFFTTIAKNDSNIMAILLLNNKKTYIHVYIIMYLSICWDSVCWTFHRRQRPSRSSTHFMIRPIGTWSTTNSQCISKYTILPTFFYCEIQQYRIILTL